MLQLHRSFSPLRPGFEPEYLRRHVARLGSIEEEAGHLGIGLGYAVWSWSARLLTFEFPRNSSSVPVWVLRRSGWQLSDLVLPSRCSSPANTPSSKPGRALTLSIGAPSLRLRWQRPERQSAASSFPSW